MEGLFCIGHKMAYFKYLVSAFYCCTVHFDNIKILFTNKYTLLLNISNVKMYS